MAAAAQEVLRVVGSTFGCTGVMLMTLTVSEQIGRSALATTLNASYFAAIVVVGQALADGAAHVPRFYWTMCAGATLALFVGVPHVGRAVARPRVGRPAPLSAE